jgi:hypothetical protein
MMVEENGRGHDRLLMREMQVPSFSLFLGETTRIRPQPRAYRCAKPHCDCSSLSLEITKESGEVEGF